MNSNNSHLKAYYEINAISQSKLKRLLNNDPLTFFEDEKPHSKAFLIGDMVDCLITRPDDFHDDFHVVDSQLPSKSVVEVCEKYFQRQILDSSPFQDTELLDAIIKEVNYGNKNWSVEAKRRTLISKGLEYYKSLSAQDGRTSVSKQLVNNCYRMAEAVKTTFSDLFNDPNTHFQYPLYSTYDNYDIKGLVDIININHDTKTINIYDVKTTHEHVLDFNFSIRKYRYDIQMAFYKMLAEKNFEGYNVNCSFIVISTEGEKIPVLYKCNPSIINVGTNGILIKEESYSINGTTYTTTKKIKGYKDLFDDLSYYENNGFNVHRDIKENNNILNMDFFGITYYYNS